VEPLAEDELILFGRSDPGSEGGNTIPFANLPRYALYTTDGEHPVRPLLTRIAKDQGIALQFGAQINSISQLKALAREGRGHTVLPRVALATEPLDGHTCARVIEPSIKLRSYVASMNNPPSRVQSVQRILRDVVQRLIQSGEWPGTVAL
jgi:LysR family nitrogen assimilation transcriptional regulator